MITVISIILGVSIALLMIMLGYDALVFLYEKYSHFHMGRWKDEREWEKRIARVCRKWVIKTPLLRLRKPCRYMLLDKLRGTYGKRMVQSWQKAGCLLGLEDAKEGRQWHERIKNQLIAPDGTWKTSVDKIDYAMMAWAILKEEQDPLTVKPAMDEMMACIKSSICSDGMVSYSAGPHATRRYVDTLGFVCPFLGEYGTKYADPSKIDLAFLQISTFRAEGGICKGLPYHCLDIDTGLPLGILGWGRGAGWYALALIDLYPYLYNPEQIASIRQWISYLAETLLQYERKDGGFSSILQTASPYDSSATAMLGYFFSMAHQILDCPEYYDAAVRCRKKLMKKTKINGVVDECQGDTIDIGIMSERYGEMPFAQGMTLRLSASLRCGREKGEE